MIHIRLNGEARTTECRTLDELARSLNLPSTGVAVAVNDDVIARGGYAGVALKDGDRIEIVHAVGGG